MSLASYARAAENICDEFREMLTASEFHHLLRSLPKTAGNDVADVRMRHDERLRRIVTAAPATRKKLLAALSVEDRFWMIAAAAQIAKEAAVVLNEADIWLVPGCPNRDMLWHVQMVLTAPTKSRDYVWPFPSPAPWDDED